MADNGHQEERTKMCPFLGKWCIKDACTLWTPIIQTQRNQLGVTTMGTGYLCAFQALPMILSRPTESHKPNLLIPKAN